MLSDRLQILLLILSELIYLAIPPEMIPGGIEVNSFAHKMVKHIHTIRRQIADEVFECV